MRQLTKNGKVWLGVVGVGCKLFLIPSCLYYWRVQHDRDWMWIAALFLIFFPEDIAYLARALRDRKGEAR